MPRVTSQHIPDRGSFTAAVSQGVLAVYQAEGLVTEDGKKDNVELRKRLIALLAAEVVEGKTTRERNEKARTKGDLVAHIFPSATGPDGFSEAEDPDLAEAVYTQLGRNLWDQLSTNYDGAIQKLLGNNGLSEAALCRAKVGPELTPAVFISTNSEVWQRDLIGAANTRAVSLAYQQAETRAMLVSRAKTLAEAKRIEATTNRTFKNLELTVRERMATAIAAREPGGTTAEIEAGDSAGADAA